MSRRRNKLRARVALLEAHLRSVTARLERTLRVKVRNDERLREAQARVRELEAGLPDARRFG